MASVFIPFAPPTVPNVPGVPALFGVALPPVALPALLTGDLLTISGFLAQRQWGIYSAAGAPILTVDAVASVEYARDYHISDYPQEQGAFMSYNKVQVPYQGKVGFLVGLNRAAFLAGIEAQVASLGLVTLVTPEKSYPNANLTHYGFRRVARNGQTLILVEVWCEEVRVTGQTQTSQAQATNGQTTGDNGQVQPTPTTAQPTNPTSGLPNLVTPPPSTAVADPTALSNPAPTIGPAFYDQFNFPLVPNDAAALAGPQQGAGLSGLSNASLGSETTGTLFISPTPSSLSAVPDVSPATAAIVSEHQ